MNTRVNTVVLALVGASCLTFLGGLIYWFLQPAHDDVTAMFSKLDSLEVEYQSGPFDKVSPVCGCFNRDLEFQGISLPAKKIELRANSDDPSFVFFSTPPDKFDFKPAISLQADIYYVRHFGSKQIESPPLHTTRDTGDPIADFDAVSFVENDDPKYMRREHLGLEQLYALDIQGASRLHVAQGGTFPLVSWTPNSNVQIGVDEVKQRPYVRESVEASDFLSKIRKIREFIPDHLMRDMQTRLAFIGVGLNNPILDFAGLPLIIWSDEIDTIYFDDKVQPVKTRSGDLVVIRLSGAFSIRMLPFGSTELVPIEGISRLTAAGTIELYEGRTVDHYVNLDYLLRKQPETTFELHAEFDKSLIDAYENAKHVSGTTRAVSAFRSLYDGKIYSMRYRYPDLTPAPGFSVFGEIKRIDAFSVVGAMSIGSKQTQISVPSNVSIRRSEKPVRTRQMNVGWDGPTLLKDFNGYVEVNGSPEAITLERFGRISLAIQLLLTISGFIGIVTSCAIVLSRVRARSK